MIEFKNVHKTFQRGNAEAIRALADINLRIVQGEFVVVIGANGSGKSTLLNALAGGVRVDAGAIYIDQHDITPLPDYRRSAWIARMFQNPLVGTAPELSVLDNFRLAALRTQAKRLYRGINAGFKRTVREKIALLEMGLEDKLEQAMGTLSGGQRQALTLIMAIMDSAKILLMDEPTAALDPKSAQNLMQKAQHIIQHFGLTALLITHDLRDAHQYGSRIIQMAEGSIVRDLDSSAKATLSRHEILEWFS